MNRNVLVNLVEQMIERIKTVSEADERDGWVPENRDAMLKFFEEMRDVLLSGQALTDYPQYRTIARGMDTLGISGGELLEEGARISSAFRELVDQEKAG